jgi:polysaccharide export outer membrane protein
MKYRPNRLWMAALALALGVSEALAAQNPPPTPPVQPPVTTPAQPTAAQQAAQAATGKTVSNEQISDAIRQSGLTQAQIQQRLRAAGYDPALANPFFTSPTAGGQASTAAGAAAANAAGAEAFAQALQSLGILSTPTSDQKPEETPKSSADRASSRAGGVFGKDIFARSTTVFDPVTAGPVDPAYRLGVGDQLQLVVTGQVELAYAIDLRRDGTVIIPQVGQVSLAGLTLEAARAVLKDRMSRSYSGLNSGEARLDLSISRIRTNAVFVIGEVETPGAYQVNALSTVFHALARAGGPSNRGSFRDIEVRRANRVIQRLDLYDYLLRGDASGDIRLEQGDVIYVPLNTRVVAVLGQVRSPHIFELRANEGFSDLLRFAGGLLPTASVERVQIDRVLPPERRAPGFERVKVDVELKGQLDSLARVRLFDGDVVQVFGVGDVRRNVVSITGAVFQPGEYEIRPAMTVGQLVEGAQGMLPWALADRAKVIRQLPLTGRTILHNVDLGTPAGKAFLLEEFDTVEILDGRTAYPEGAISIEGAVVTPITRRFSEGESLLDAIERAGGLREEAQRIELYRKRKGTNYSDTTTIRFSFPVNPGVPRDPALRSFILERDDHIAVLFSPGYRAQQFVTVTGQFTYPGMYSITENVDRIRDVVRRAGDVLPGAYPAGFHLIRGGRDVSVDFARAMRGDQAHDMPLMGGDQLVIGRDPNTVLVTGGVSRASLIRFRPGLSIKDYVELAGGPTERGRLDKAVVQLPSGISERVKRVALFFHTSPTILSGSVITVPEDPPPSNNGPDTWQRVLTAATALASMVLAYAAVTK